MPARRAQAAAEKRDIDLSDIRGRRFTEQDFHEFDYILAMDQDNLGNIEYLNPGEARGRPHLLLDFARKVEEREVPDPYYGGNNGFEYVLDLVEEASHGLLEHIRAKHDL